jgi:peptidylprolyl isomerase
MTAARRLLWLFLVLATACASSTPPPPERPRTIEPAPTREPAPSSEGVKPYEPVLPLEPLPAGPVAPPTPDPNAPPDLAAAPADAQRTASGLASKVLQPGIGKEHPAPGDSVRVNVTGWMTDGVKFDSSADRGQPDQYEVGKTIPGWTEGLQQMVEGEKRRFWIPAGLAWGDQARRAGGPHGPVVFDIELLSVRRKPAPPEVPADLNAPPADAVRTRSGLAYRVLQKGTGTAHPGPRSVVEVHYSGWTLDGKMFDSSVLRGEPASFPVNGVIRGWTEGLQLMVVGEKARLWIPSKLAYGDSPAAGMPAGPLVFDVELLGIKPAYR